MLPLVLVAATRMKLRPATVLLPIGLISLVVSILCVGFWPTAAFYLLPARAFELLDRVRPSRRRLSEG